MHLVYFSPVPWHSFAQRPHKFVEWFQARKRGQVLWVDPYPTRLPIVSDMRFHRKADIPANVSNEAVPQWLQVVRPWALPIEPLPGLALLNRVFFRETLKQIEQFLVRLEACIGIGKPSDLALITTKRWSNLYTFYDAMDDFPAFYKGISRSSMAAREKLIAQRVKRIVVSSTKLAGKFVTHKDKTVIALNACSAWDLPLLDLSAKKATPPVIGYVGTIGDWFDWTLVVRLANENKDKRIRLIGPVFSSPPDVLPDNIEILPACEHASAIRAMQEFSVGLIPFKNTNLTSAVDPIKYYEYRAMGLPVISTDFGEMALRRGHDGIFLIDEQCSLSNLMLRALAYQPDQYEIQQFRNANSWDARFDACRFLD
jgi:hypothetical protein